MIQVYKILHGLEDIPQNSLLKLASEGIPRGHSLTLMLHKPRHRTAFRQHSFRVRVIEDWNGLPEGVVTAPTLNTFKNRLDRHWAVILYDH